MAKTLPFEIHYEQYDKWFDQNEKIYESELLAVQSLLPSEGNRIEIGVGSGRFAARLGIREGVEPAAGIAKLACARGICVKRGTAEALPLPDAAYDAVLLVTTLCFVDDVKRTFAEAHRVLKANGCIVLAFIPKDSPFGRFYDQIRDSDEFFRAATFYTKQAVFGALRKAGFAVNRTVQTLTRSPQVANDTVEEPSPGHDRGSFVVVRATKHPSP